MASSSPAALHPTRTEVGVESVLLMTGLGIAVLVVLGWVYVCRRAALFRTPGKGAPSGRVVWTNPRTQHVLEGNSDDEASLDSDEDGESRRGSGSTASV